MSTPRTAHRNAPLWLTVLLVLIGIACVIAGIVYFAEPANSLPGFFPGHSAQETKKHIKHGIAAVVVGVIFLIGAWISTGRKRTV